MAAVRLTEDLGAWRARPGPLATALAAALRDGVLDGRIPSGSELPSEREVAYALGVSRGTVVAALDRLRDDGWVATRHGSGSLIRLPPSLTERTLPLSADRAGLDLRAAVTSAPHQACLAALDRAGGRFAAALLDDGEAPGGLACLREAVAARYTAAGLATQPAQVLITSGARAAVALLLGRFHDRRRPVLVESPSYPGVLAQLRHARARTVTVPVTGDGWDEDRFRDVLRSRRPGLAYLMPDFHNPAGAVMPRPLRAEVSVLAERTDCVILADETMRDLDLREEPRPEPHLAGRNVISVGSASKLFWGGLRIGWIRAATRWIAELQLSPLAGPVSPPPLEQLIAVELLADEQRILGARRAQLRGQRDHLVGLLRELPGWSFRPPPGGLSLWLRHRDLTGQELAARAAARGLLISPGERFAADGTLVHHLRLPFTAGPEVLTQAAGILGSAISGP
jgi:DNA-binding transcriptional MocR family regulator